MLGEAVGNANDGLIGTCNGSRIKTAHVIIDRHPRVTIVIAASSSGKPQRLSGFRSGSPHSSRGTSPVRPAASRTEIRRWRPPSRFTKTGPETQEQIPLHRTPSVS
jgi:hypothetical protein